MDDFAGYSTYLTRERHAAPNTLASYLRDVNQFSKYLESRDCALREATSEMVLDCIGRMLGKGKSAASVTRFLAAVKSFYNYLISIGERQANPAVGVTVAKTERKYPEVLSSKEVELLLEQPQ